MLHPFHPTRLSAPLLLVALATGCSGLPSPPETGGRAPGPATERVQPPAATAQPGRAGSRTDDDAATPSDPGWPTVDPLPPAEDVWEVLRREYRLPEHRENAEVVAFRARLLSYPKTIHALVERARPWLPYILAEVQRRGMPGEIALLPTVESGFDPLASSRGRAAGMWQFITSTARRYGLAQTPWYDGRRDVIDSTGAALNYLEALRDRFDGDWLLALAAYNAGEGAVSRAVEHNRAKGRPTDFFSLSLPRETRVFVPRLFAWRDVLGDPERWKLAIEPIPHRVPFVVEQVPGQVDLGEVARLIDLDVDDLYHLNAGLNRRVTPPGPGRLLIPADRADRFRAAIASLPTRTAITPVEYVIRPGDSLGAIARRHGTTVAEIQAANGMQGTAIRAGRTLIIPSGHGSAPALAGRPGRTTERPTGPPPSQAPGGQRTRYAVRSGDSLWTIARQFGTTVDELAGWNRLSPKATLNVGQALEIRPRAPKATRPAESGSRTVHYVVVPGDSLAKIARRLEIPLDELQAQNRIGTDARIHPGQILTWSGQSRTRR